MLDRTMLYDLIYALAAIDGREEKLFGDCAPLAHEAFMHGLAGSEFPEVWFELPLLGDPWFDLHVLTSRAALEGNAPDAEMGAACDPALFSWFAQERDGRQLALSFDVGAGDIDHPAVQLLVSKDDGRASCDFLAQAGRSDIVPAYRAFHDNLPDGWFPCYVGTFPGRDDQPIHVECIPRQEKQAAYARNYALLAQDLRAAGLKLCGDTILPRCRKMLHTGSPVEYQFEIMPDGSVGPTFSASARLCPDIADRSRLFSHEPVARLFEQVEEWGLADDRWRLLADAAFAKRLSRGSDGFLISCVTIFLKLKWRNGEPVDAKVYLAASAR